MSFKLKQNVRFLKGVGPARAKALNQLSIISIKDLLTHLPARYEDRRKVKNIALIENNETALVKGKVLSRAFIPLRGKKSLLKVKIKGGSGIVNLLCFNQPYLKNVLRPSDTVFVYGRFERTEGKLKSSNFSFEKIKKNEKSKVHVGRIVPVYLLTSGISQKWLRRLIFDALLRFESNFFEFIPENILKEENLYRINEAIRKVHFPDKIFQAEKARRTLVTGEFLLYQGSLALKKKKVRQKPKEHSYKIRQKLLKPFRRKLNFEFTSDQKKAIKEIFSDMCSPYPMRRLLQGEVGSGKTVVALAAVLLAVENSHQGAVVAPTEILAEQHYLTFRNYCNHLGVKISLLTSSTPRKVRAKILKNLQRGDIDIIVGTHALFEDEVEMGRVKILIVDEQHRFGVRQKGAILKKNTFMDNLSMSATPIPRTMAMCTYEDFDISTIRELPPGRRKPDTKYVSSPAAYAFALGQIRKGNRAYIVHPVIEESKKNNFKSAEKRFKLLSKGEFKNIPCALLHGRMKSKEKEKVMKNFAQGRNKVLFTTTVVEVGINVPEATVMIIENFERYGLSTLHQLRGRIARSHRRPYCFLTGSPKTKKAKRRLQIILNTSDGFKIAREDMKLRGSGELFGTRQHGRAEFKYGDPVENIKELKTARKHAFNLVSEDSNLELKENSDLKKAIKRKYGRTFHFAGVS